MYEITHRTEAPYRAICYIECTWMDGSRTSASGVVVGVNDVLTAMHVVYDASRGGWARDILISPAADTWPTLQQPLGTYADWGEVDARTQDWDRDGDGLVTTAEAQWDLALIGLQSRIADATGWVHAAPAVAGASGLMVGYPARGTGMMAEQVYAVPSSSYGVFEIPSLLGAGASGGPLLQWLPQGGVDVVGVLSSGSTANNHSTYAGLHGNGTWNWFLRALIGNDDQVSGTAQWPDDHGASAQASGALSLNVTLAARLERVGDVDWFRVDLTRGVYAIDVQGASTQQGTLGDPMVSLYAADGSLLAQDDDSGAGFNALLECAVVRPGSYYVAVSAPSTSPAGTAGTYAVRLSPVAETLVAGTAQGDTAASSAANEWFEAGAGTDRWILHGPRSHYAVTALAGGRWSLTDSVPGRDGQDTLADVERLVFTDRVLALDLQKDEPAGRASLLLGVALGPQALGNMALVGALVAYFDGGPSLVQAAQLLVDSGALAQWAGGADSASFVHYIYQNAVGTPPSEATQAALAGYLDGGLLSRAEMFRIVAESPVHQQHIDLVGLQTRGLEYTSL